MTGPRGLRTRPRPVRDARLFIIATEGHDERAYFECLKDAGLVQTRIVVELVPIENDASSPSAVLARAKAGRANYGTTLPDDRVWCVLDVDHHAEPGHVEELTTALADARKSSIDVAVSAPCFEIWYLLHHQDLTEEPLRHKAAVRSACSQVIRDHRLRGGVPPACIDRARIAKAIERAKSRDVESDRWPQRPGTQLHRLVASLLG